jgi:hypothetical protein
MPVHSGGPNSTLPPVVTLVILVIFVAIDLWVALNLINDLYKPERRVNGDKNTWAAIILLGSVLGMLAYVLVGRED